MNHLKTKNLFIDDSIIINLINSKLLNNPNLNANLNINIDTISSRNFLKNFAIKIFFKEGNLFIKNSSINWNDTILINFEDVQLENDKKINKLIGLIKFKFQDLENFYSYYQVKRDFRSKINNIDFNFVYDLNQRKITIDNLKVDDNSNQKLNVYLNKFNSQNKNMFNKYTLRNFVREFFSHYEG
tara:strand:- start:175 stop:729 length:555 start_codon:yes stop_codon:yes gene_type:complete